MPEDLKQSVKNLVEVINAGIPDGVNTFERFLHPSFVSHGPDGDLFLPGFKIFIRNWIEAFPDVRCTIDHLIQEGSTVSWTLHAKGTHKDDFMGIAATGNAVDFMSMHVCTGTDGKAGEHWVVIDSINLLVQLGLAPKPG